MDNLTKEQRSKNMRSIRSTNTLPEKILMNELRRKHIYFAKHVKKIFGTPDIVFRRKRIVVFIDSDFWHGNMKRFVLPTSNISYWKKKIESNKIRDKQVNYKLKNDGWTILRFWEYDVTHNTIHVMTKLTEILENKAKS